MLTRLHARYGKDTLGEDLVFRKVAPIVGGREFRTDGKLEKGSKTGRQNNFQGRYAIRHPWSGRMTCKKPIRGRWGGPPKQKDRVPDPQAALDLAFAPRGGVKLANFVQQDIAELDIKANKPKRKPSSPVPRDGAPTKDVPIPGGDAGLCSCQWRASPPPTLAVGWLFALGLALVRRRR